MGDKKLFVHRPGSKVWVDNESLECTVSCAIIEPGGQVYYELLYWRDGEVKMAKVHSSFIDLVDDTPSTEVGYKGE